MTDTKTNKQAVSLGGSINQSIHGIVQHITEPQELEKFAKDIGIRADWRKADEQGISAEFHGKTFNNDGFWGAKVAIEPDSLEQYITIHKNNMPIAEVNLAALFSWSSLYQMKMGEPVQLESPKNELVFIEDPEHHESFDMKEFDEFLNDLLSAQVNETIQKTFLDFNTIAVTMTVDGKPVRRAWCLAQVSDMEDKILVSDTTGVHEFNCMTYADAWDALQEIISDGADNIKDNTTLFNIVAGQVRRMDAHDLFKVAMEQSRNIGTNWYDIVNDLHEDAEEVLASHVEQLSSGDINNEELIEVASKHFDLGTDMILETAGCKCGADGDDWLAVAQEMEMDVPENIKKLIEKGDPHPHHRKQRC